jgi:hypothetical protein
VAEVGERRITYDARGLAEPHADAPNIARIEDGTATFDARDLTTRQINLELRRLLYEEGIKEVTVENPGAKHSLGVGILTRCKISFEGSLGYFGCGLIDGPEIHISGRGSLSSRATPARWPLPPFEEATSSSRGKWARARASTRRAARSSSSATPAR